MDLTTSKKKKIVVIGLKGLPAFGGAAAVGECLIEKLKDDFDFTILSVSTHTSLKTGFYNGYKQIVFRKIGSGGIRTFFYYLNCLLHCLVNKYDLVHLHHSESGFITPLLRLRFKVIVTFHGIFRDDYTDPRFSKFSNRFFRFSSRLNMSFANVVVSVSKPDKDYLDERHNREILYVPNGIDLNLKLAEKKLNKKYILFSAGRVYQIKGLHLLLSAAKQMELDCEIKVVGNLDLVPEYKAEIVEQAKNMDVSFVGLIKDKDELMAIVKGAELFVFPSLTEAMSMMLLEVVSVNTPVIASDIPSNVAVFDESEVLFFRNNDSCDLAEKMRYAITNKDEMSRMAANAYSKLKRDYTWNQISARYKDLYLNLMGGAK